MDSWHACTGRQNTQYVRVFISILYGIYIEVLGLSTVAIAIPGSLEYIFYYDSSILITLQGDCEVRGEGAASTL